MQTLFIFTDILKALARIESQILNLSTAYQSAAPRNEIDEALIAQFQAKATELSTASAALLTLVYTPPAPIEEEPIEEPALP